MSTPARPAFDAPVRVLVGYDLGSGLRDDVVSSFAVGMKVQIICPASMRRSWVQMLALAGGQAPRVRSIDDCCRRKAALRAPAFVADIWTISAREKLYLSGLVKANPHAHWMVLGTVAAMSSDLEQLAFWKGIGFTIHPSMGIVDAVDPQRYAAYPGMG